MSGDSENDLFKLANSSEAFKNYIRGWDAFKYRELLSAAEWFTKAIEEDSTFISAYVFNSYANIMYGSTGPAKHWAKKAFEYRSYLGIEEIKYLKQLVELDKMNPSYWHQLGIAYHKLGEHAKEENIAELGLDVYPEAVLIIQNQAICAFSHRETVKAEKILAKYKTMRQEVLHGTEAIVSTGVGTIYSSSGQFEKAEDLGIGS